MLGTHINHFDLDQGTLLNNRFIKSPTLAISLVCLLGASACTSSNSSPSLIAKPTIADTLASVDGTDPQTGLQTDIPADNGLSSPELARIPLPKPAPNITPERQQELQAKHQTSLLSEATNQSTQSNLNNSQAVANLNNAQISAPNAGLNNLKTASIKRQAPERKLNFFERLLKNRRDGQAGTNLDSKKSRLDAEVLRRAKTKTLFTSNEAPLAKSDATIKEGVKLLKVEEDQNHEDDSSVQVASVGALGRTSGPHGLILQTQGVQVACLKPKLLTVLKKVERRFGKKVMVTSGYRSPARNRRAGGVKNSTHTTCAAADIQVAGISKWNIAKYLRSLDGRGGVGTYCRTKSVHIDIGSQRDWHQPCRRRK